MAFEIWETCRILKRNFDGYISSRRAFIIVLIAMAVLLYVGPSLFRWLIKKSPMISDPSTDCINSLLDPFLRADSVFDGSVSHSYAEYAHNFLPFIGNGYIGLFLDKEESIYIFNKRSLSVPLNYSPVVHVDVPGVDSEGAAAMLYTQGTAYKFKCYNVKQSAVSVVHQFYAYRIIPSVFVQHIEITNPSNHDVTLSLYRSEPQYKKKNIPISLPNGDAISYRMFYNSLQIPNTERKMFFSISNSVNPDSVIVKAKSSKFLTFQTAFHYSDVKPTTSFEALASKLEVLARKDLQRILNDNHNDIWKKHVNVWQKLWHSGFSISFSKAQGALNGDKINATLYYVLSNTREYISELDTSDQHIQSLQNYMYSPDNCYSGHHTLQASTLWSKLQTSSDILKIANLWFLTLSKQGCHNLLLAGATGVIQAMILSFGGLKFSNHHLEFDCEPKDLHRDYHFRRITYGDSTHVNISVKVQEDNKAVLYCALDRSDKDYYACDGGCLDPPVKLGSEPVLFPVKLTSPVTAILYITADKQHMEELKHTIHVKEIAEAPAHEHHVIALHRHGHQLGGLPAFFWVSIVFLIVIFHLFLIKLVYNEYCGNQDRQKKRYIV